MSSQVGILEVSATGSKAAQAGTDERRVTGCPIALQIGLHLDAGQLLQFPLGKNNACELTPTPFQTAYA